jgi:hypothetical protein
VIINFPKYLLLLAIMLFLSGCASSLSTTNNVSNQKTSVEEGEAVQGQHSVELADKALAQAFEVLGDLKAVAKDLEKNQRFRELNKKSKDGTSTIDEAKELREMFDKEFEKRYLPTLLKKDLGAFTMLAFDDPRCQKCKDGIELYRAILKEFGITKVDVISPGKFESYLKNHKIPYYNFDAAIWLTIFDNKEDLAKKLANSTMPIFLYQSENITGKPSFGAVGSTYLPEGADRKGIRAYIIGYLRVAARNKE